MQKQSVIALFLSTANSINLGFSDMPEGEYNLDASFVQVTSRAAAQTESGVRARWVELPDCRHWCNHLDVDGKPNDPAGDGQPGSIYIPLRDDLANAIIATCKGPEPGYGPDVCVDPVPPTPPAGFVPNPATQIFDGVWKTDTVIPDNEHQVNVYGVANNTHMSEQVDGPKGDFYTHWNWDHQSKDAEWDHEGAYGVNYTGDMTEENNTIGSILPDPPALIQLDFMEAHDKKWVELPDCSGAGDEIILAADLANASVATCKTRPAL
jgi:hypothetical protein